MWLRSCGQGRAAVPSLLPEGLSRGHVSTATLCPVCDLKGIKGAPHTNTCVRTHTRTHTVVFVGVEVKMWLTDVEVQAWVGRWICERPRGVCACGLCVHVLCMRDVCGMVVGCGCWVSALILPEPPPSQPGPQQAQRPGASPAQGWELVPGCRATAPPAGRLSKGPGAVYVGEAPFPLPGGPGLPTHPP